MSSDKSAANPLAQTLESGDGADTPEEKIARARTLPAVGQSGRLIGEKYRLGALLGQGGMGAVYLADHLQLAREVAIKMLSPDCSKRPNLLLRFEREARLAAAIGHENIVGILDFGKTAEGEPFIVMERLQGQSLKQLIDSPEPLQVSRLIKIVDQILAALQAAHGKGIVHRDIKPENVFVSPGEDHDRVKVLDFGISKVTSAESESLHLTATGALLGTPMYMSPEQAMGRTDVDHRADLYAVGVILYRALAGAFPFAAENFNQLVCAVAMRAGLPLSKSAPSTPPELLRIVETAMAHDRNERYQTAREFREALRSLPDASLSGATPPGLSGTPALSILQTTPPQPSTAAAMAPLTAVPAVVPLASVLPAATAASRSAPTPAAAIPPPPNSVVPLVVAGVLALSLTGGLAFWFSRQPINPEASRVGAPGTVAALVPMRDAGSIPLANSPSVTPAEVRPPTLDGGAATVEPREITVEVSVEPRSARLKLNGELVDNPLRTVIARAPRERLHLEAAAPGYLTESIRPYRDADLSLKLELKVDRRRVGATVPREKLQIKTRVE